MGKPSIFSKEYQRHKKRKRKKIAFLVLLLIASVIFFVYVSPVTQLIKGSSLYKELQAKYKDNGTQTEQQQGSSLGSEKPNDISDGEDSGHEGNVIEEKYFEVSLTEEEKGKAYYKESNDKIIFLSYAGGEKFTYEVSPSGEKMLIFDTANQNIYEVEAENSIKNLTYEYYTTTKGSKIYKDTTLSSNPEYLWHGTPRYISEDKIAFRSYLPWLNSTNEYIWIVDTSTSSFTFNNSSKGSKIEFGTLSEEGLQLTIDGVNKIMKSDGSLS